jgi:hypothetical protein
MAITYDPNKPLDEDTRARLLERNRWQEVEENDRRFANTDSEDPEEDENDSGEDLEEDPDEDENPNDLVMDEIRAELTKREIPWNRKMRKAELVALLRQDEESSSDSRTE